MTLDYLRYIAFRGRLANFFREGYQQLAPEEIVTGLHLSFDERFLEESGALRFIDRYDPGRYGDRATMLRLLGIKIPRSYSAYRDQFSQTASLSTVAYEEEKRPEVNVLIDIEPKRWAPAFEEPRSIEGGVRVYFRRSGVAQMNLSSGARISTGSAGALGGTLCGLVNVDDSKHYGLTCGHVVEDLDNVFVDVPRRWGRFQFGRKRDRLGRTLQREFFSNLSAYSHGATQPSSLIGIDAALLELDNQGLFADPTRSMRFASPRPISCFVQEELVAFQGSGRAWPVKARVKAVTVRKTLTLVDKRGSLRSVQAGDLVQLGHPAAFYFNSPVSRPGDSGSAIMSVDARYRGHDLDWLGMLIAGDENSSYASYAEIISVWIRNSLNCGRVDFYV